MLISYQEIGCNEVESCVEERMGRGVLLKQEAEGLAEANRGRRSCGTWAERLTMRPLSETRRKTNH